MAGKQKKGMNDYTTRIFVMQTAMEITHLLEIGGVRKVKFNYAKDDLVALTFFIKALGKRFAVRLPCNVASYKKGMARNPDIPKQYKIKEQAKRTAWRNLKAWVEIQMAFIETNQAEMVEIFLPYIITKNKQTLFQRFTQDYKHFLAGNKK